MINAVHHDKSFMFIGATFREKLVFTFELIKAVSDTILEMIGALYSP